MESRKDSSRVKGFEVDQTINGDGTYTLNKTIVYFSPRYGKTITVEAPYDSDGATGAMDITSRGWWVHDKLCDTGRWDDGTPLSNWQCSQVLQDIMTEEGRKWQGIRWFWATWLIGGGMARKNGMIFVALALLILAGCTTINCTADNGAKVEIRTDRNIDTLPIRAEGNTIPVSAVP